MREAHSGNAVEAFEFIGSGHMRTSQDASYSDEKERVFSIVSPELPDPELPELVHTVLTVLTSASVSAASRLP